MALEMKYFVLKPKSKHKGDPYAKASRMAINVYAAWVKHIDPEMSKELIKWTMIEESNDFALAGKECEENNDKNL